MMRGFTLKEAVAILILVGCHGESTKPKESPRPPPFETGHLQGTVFWRGKPLERSVFTVPQSLRKFCGDEVSNTSPLGPHGELAEVVVSLQNAPPTPELPSVPEPRAAVVDQQKCRYEPNLIAVRSGTRLEVRNSDPLLHNVRGEMLGHALFNVAMPLQGLSFKKTLPPREETVELHCDLHPWMLATVKVFPHPYFVISGADGKFVLKNLPQGRQTLSLWHRQLGAVSRQVNLVPNQTLHQDLFFDEAPEP